MKSIFPALATTFLLYIGSFVAFYLTDFSTQGAVKNGIRQSFFVLGAAGVVILGAFLYSFYKAVAHDPRWWFVVGLHIVLAALIGRFMLGY